MLDFDDMVLPKGKTIESIARSSIEKIAEIGSSNSRFSTVCVAGMKQVVANPEVREAWAEREGSQTAPARG